METLRGEGGDGDLDVHLLRDAYCRGIFPMADPASGRIEWYRPDPRGILPLQDLHVSRSLRRVLQRNPYEILADTCFARVVAACAAPRPGQGDGESWIDDSICDACITLHEMGDAHSVEAWHGGTLVGGLYGVHLGGAFFGESMFSCPGAGGTNASKLCLIHLVRHLRKQDFSLLDVQFSTPHLAQFGVVEVTCREYDRRLDEALRAPATWGTWIAWDGCG